MAKTIPGQAGGRAVVRKYGTLHMAEIGSRGGDAVVDKYGFEYMSLLGTLGSDAVNESLSPSRRQRVEGRVRRIIRDNQ
jgi:hypothetical protein